MLDYGLCLRLRSLYLIRRLSAEALTGRLRDPYELDMVRHECAEALGSVGGKEVEEELGR